MKIWKTLQSTNLINTPWLKVFQEKCEIKNGKIIDDFYTLWQPDWVLILARTPEKKWVFTRQYRHGSKEISLEFPAGILENGENPINAALRELKEECGYSANFNEDDKQNIAVNVGKFFVNPDRHRGVYHVIFVDNVVCNSKQLLDNNEEIEILLLNDEEVLEKIKDGILKHPLQIAGYFKWKLNFDK